ncbi:MAG: dTMP kinase [Armatimonadota bacterium]|nr:dTMP kinase [Armatimonadota bacterium]
MPHAPLITFEGIEGAGKTTLAQHLAEWLHAHGIPVRLTREPGGSTLGTHLRPILLHEPLDAWTELFLFLADRRQHTLQVILPALEQGVWVLCDRYADSTLIYQGYGRGLDTELIRRLNAIATDNLTPDLTVLIDLPVEDALARANAPNRFEAETRAFHERIREGYLELARAEPSRFLVLDGRQPLETLKASLELAVQRRFLGG